ncbi:MAG: PAS domain S-box protein, partial [Gemmatimonadaceae bacterium]
MPFDRPDPLASSDPVSHLDEDRRYRVLAETAPDAIITLDEDSCILSVNPAAERIFGWRAAEMTGQSLSMLMPERFRTANNSGIMQYLRTGDRQPPSKSVFVHGLAKDGREIPMEISFGEFADDGRRIFAGFMRDVSDRVAQQKLLERTKSDLELALAELESRVREAETARRAADEANAAKSRFLATMSHELRTPLNAIGGYVELLETGLRGELNEAQRSDLRRVRRAQARLLELINDILNFAKLETGRVGYDIRDVGVADLLSSLGALIEPQVQAKGIAYECVPGRDDVTACADPQKLEQILLNLLSNAVKFTEPGGLVTLSTSADADEV